MVWLFWGASFVFRGGWAEVWIEIGQVTFECAYVEFDWFVLEVRLGHFGVLAGLTVRAGLQEQAESLILAQDERWRHA